MGKETNFRSRDKITYFKEGFPQLTIKFLDYHSYASNLQKQFIFPTLSSPAIPIFYSNKMKNLLLLVFVLGIVSSIAQPGDAFQLDVPPKGDIYYKSIKKKQKDLNLKKLEKGTKGVEIRVWFEYELQTFGELVVIQKKKKKWKGEYYRFEEKKASKKHILGKISSFKKKKTKPQIGWLSFIRELESLDVYSLPGEKRQKNYLPNRDGVTYIVEVATADSYRFYSYWCPDSKDGGEAEKMSKITELFREEFRFPVVFVCEPTQSGK